MSLAFLRPALAGAAATCAGNGLARFAYVPLFPAMVAAGWVDGGEAGLLGAVNLTGYLAGALGGRAVARALGVPRALDLGMALAALAFAACAWNGGLAWLAAWRLLAGIAGGVLMALAGPAVQTVVPPQRRGAAGGVVIAGVGGGVALASVAVPLLLPGGLPATWLALALLTLALWGFAHPRWPLPPPAEGGVAHGPVPRAAGLVVAYALSGAGMVAPMVYLADLAARGRALGVAAGSLMWLLFGLGGILGTLAGGRAADRLGGRRSIALWLAVQAVALGLLLLPWTVALVPGTVLCGFAAMGISAVALAAARERAGAQAGVIWVRVTAGFAVAQAVTGFALAALFAATGEAHGAVFGAGLALSLAAFAVGAADQRGPRVDNA
jgi:predicted MFS family arabinose efflux permease